MEKSGVLTFRKVDKTGYIEKKRTLWQAVSIM